RRSHFSLPFGRKATAKRSVSPLSSCARQFTVRKPLRKTFLPGSFLSRGESRLVKMPYSSGFVASTTCGDDGYEELMSTTAGSCTVTLSITGATLRLMNAVVTELTTTSFEGFGIVSFHCT